MTNQMHLTHDLTRIMKKVVPAFGRIQKYSGNSVKTLLRNYEDWAGKSSRFDMIRVTEYGDDDSIAVDFYSNLDLHEDTDADVVAKYDEDQGTYTVRGRSTTLNPGFDFRKVPEVDMVTEEAVLTLSRRQALALREQLNGLALD